MDIKIIKSSVGTELSKNPEELFSYLEEQIERQEELSVLLGILSNVLDKSFSFYFFPELKMSYGLTDEKIEALKRRGLKVVERTFRSLLQIAAREEDKEVREEALYILAKFLPQTELPFASHLKFALFLLTKLISKQDEKLALKAALRHDLKALLKQFYPLSRKDEEVKPYEELLKKLKERVAEKEAQAYYLISATAFKELDERDREMLRGRADELKEVLKEAVKREVAEGLIDETALKYAENLMEERKLPQSFSSLEDRAFSTSFKISSMSKKQNVDIESFILRKEDLKFSKIPFPLSDGKDES
jgi:AcrR family transcriptional regulator